MAGESEKEATPPGEEVLPSPDQKQEYVRTMFDAIAPRYDLLNSLLSARLHYGWRRAAARETQLQPGNHALDVCTGTGDLAFELARAVGSNGTIVGTDFSHPMLRIGAHKAHHRRGGPVYLALADTQALPFPDAAFDAVTVAFGIRNVADIPRGLCEMARVTRPGGRVVILEFTQPRNKFFLALYNWYSFTLMPWIGGLLSGRRSAYEYLPSSVAAFYTREELADLMRASGLTDVRVTDHTFGIVAIHRGTKADPVRVSS